MIPVLSKPRDEIDISDIEYLIDSQVPEGGQIEFKGTLPAKKGAVDPWINGGQIGDRAKNGILEEAVAFANAHGGALLLGIKESDTKPPVAAEISPIPRCAELAERLKLVFRDCVEPQIPVLDVFAVSTEGESGVVIIRVGRSRHAPHRVTKTLVCPIRRADRCEEMSMREIQDMTLNVSRGLERLDKRLAERSERFQEEFNRLKTPDDAFGIRMTAISVGDEIWFDRVVYGGSIISGLDTPKIKVSRQSNSGKQDQNTLHDFFEYPSWRPMLRATRWERFNNSTDEPLRYNLYRELHCDGLIELGFLSGYSTSDEKDSLQLSLNTPIQLFANLAAWAAHVGRQANAPTAEYALEVEIYVKGGPVSVKRGYVLPLDMDSEKGKLQPGSTKFPKYPLGDGHKIPELLTLFHRDFWHSLGKGVGPREPAFRIEGWPAP